ncbi:MAG TPA: aminotransferase class I/II-fold pyridoxal phosphate-dependent enzyme [Candidatus Dormibacteraeota bacterium]|nr:aminotransferase class I/II-fold pyridoxal phosphate-dependent enzyme [Candidatus Dormibacteraeota bacterium]
MSFISQRLTYFDSSDFRTAMRRQAELVNPIDLSIGVPEELTAEHIKAAGIAAIQSDKTVYTPAAGILELRLALAKKLNEENKLNHTADTITIVPGLTTGLLLVYLAILDPGDEIIVFDPYYPPYPHLASMIGAHVVYVSTLPDFQPDLHALEASITNRTKVIVINTPNNPSGAIYPESNLRKIAAIAERHNLLVISDEIYEHFAYETAHFSIGSIYPNTITMNGFSKEYAMTGWRLGYVAGPSDIIDAINELQQYVVMSSSSIAQHAGLAAIQRRPDVVAKYSLKRKYALDRLRHMGYSIHGAQGAYYIFLKAPNDLTDLEFVEQASDHGLIIVAGRAFSRLNGFVRLSYGADMETLKRGLDVLEKITSLDTSRVVLDLK